MAWMRLMVLPPWRRAPVRLLESASLFCAVGVAAMVLGVAGGSRPLFASSSASAALHSDVTSGCAFDVGMRIQRQASTEVPLPPSAIGQVRPPADVGKATAVLDRDVAPLPGINPAVITLFGGNAHVARGAAGNAAAIQLLYRSGFADHVDVVSAVRAPGIWLPDTTARTLGVHAGDRVVLQTNFTNTPFTVHAVFRDLATVKRDGTWCSMQQTLDGFGTSVPSPTALLDRATLMRVLSRSGTPTVDVWWEYAPSPKGWTIAKAKRSISALTRIASASNNLSLPEGAVLGFGTSSVDDQLTMSHADQASSTGSASVGPVALGGAGVALLILLIGARTWLERRRREVTVLALRGAGPGALALKGVAEMATPMLLGGAVGIAGAYFIVRTVGPSAYIEPHAVVSAAELVAVALVVALLAVALVVWLGVRRIGIETSGAAVRPRLLLWEPAVLAVAGAAFYELSTKGTSAPASGAGSHVDSLVLLFPVLLLAGCAGLLARAVLSEGVLRRGTDRLSTGTWLGARRVASGRLRAIPLVTGAAVAIGIVVFSGTLAATLRATITAKSTLGPGTAQAFTLGHAQPLPAKSPLRDVSTEVTRAHENADGGQSHAPADVLGVDPATFAGGAYWDRSFAGASLHSLLTAVSNAPTHGVTPVIAVGAGLPDTFVLSLDAQHGSVATSANVNVRVVARARAFPGLGFESSRPLVVIDREALTRAGVINTPELWVNRSDPRVRSELRTENLPVMSVVQASDFTPGDLSPQLWALRYLQVIGLIAGLVTLCGLGLYFAGIADRRRLGTALSRQLGLPRRTAIAATATEIATMLSAGLLFGVVLSVLAVRLVFDHIDPAPQIAPAALFRLDFGSIAICAIGVLVATALVTAIVEVRAGRSSLPELLRRAH